ncbi:MAG TPA: carboxypeptidase-like regulatory domain-containing protein [Chitinispirillaceae bacterium]|nr:carboxypeptidase-like regulatory domain-containing protein [Chitinispirillaceae bacterium]
MVRITTVLLVSSLWISSFSQTIKLDGTISNSKGKAIVGASVKLYKAKVTVTTNSKGAYSIESETAVLSPETVAPSADLISFKNRSLIVDLSKPATVKIETFDMKGTLIKRVTEQVASAGSYSFNPDVQGVASGMQILRVEAGDLHATFRSMPSKNGNQFVASSVSPMTLQGGELAKVKAVVDTLTITAAGYYSKNVPISSYSGTNNVTLDTMALEKFSFFVTSLKAIQELSKSENGFGGDLRFGKTGQGAGLLGADSICSCIAERSMPGSRVKQWRAFLSVTKGPNGTAVNAIDRVGTGPWYDRLGRTVALTKSDLANTRPKNCDEDIVNDLPNEDGVPNHRPDPTKEKVDNHMTMTGSDDKGMLYSADASSTCQDWTSKEGKGGNPRSGLSWPRGGFMFKSSFSMGGSTWISDWDLSGCAAGICLVEKGGPLPNEDFVGSGGGYGGFYCFALNP